MARKKRKKKVSPTYMVAMPPPEVRKTRPMRIRERTVVQINWLRHRMGGVSQAMVISKLVEDEIKRLGFNPDTLKPRSPRRKEPLNITPDPEPDPTEVEDEYRPGQAVIG